jgi:hypothetical protein
MDLRIAKCDMITEQRIYHCLNYSRVDKLIQLLKTAFKKGSTESIKCDIYDCMQVDQLLL